MAIPDFQSLMLPLLKFTSDQQEHGLRDITENLAKTFNLSKEEKNERLPSGRQELFYNRVGWACAYLKNAGLIASTRRGFSKITQRGLNVLKQNPKEINIKFLEKFPEFLEYRNSPSKDKPQKIEEITSRAEDKLTPEEILEDSYQKIKETLAQDLLTSIKGCSPNFFESLVVELLVKMGYGGSIKDAGKAIGKVGDDGIDGIINEDKLGLDVIYIQAKRWDGNVGRPEIQKFAGALQGNRAKKGIFITTSAFTKDASDFTSRIESKIVLIDGALLAQLMIDYDIGVSEVASYEIKRIDSDYFTEG